MFADDYSTCETREDLWLAADLEALGDDDYKDTASSQLRDLTGSNGSAETYL